MTGKLDSNHLPRQPCPTSKSTGCPLTHPVPAFKKCILSCSNVFGSQAGVLGAEPLFFKCSLQMTTAVE